MTLTAVRRPDAPRHCWRSWILAIAHGASNGFHLIGNEEILQRVVTLPSSKVAPGTSGHELDLSEYLNNNHNREPIRPNETQNVVGSQCWVSSHQQESGPCWP